jgi:transposase
MILLAATGLLDLKIGAELGVKRQTVARWRSRFNRLGLAGIEKDAPPGRKPQISAKRVKQIVRMTTQEKPKDATPWSTRSTAQVAGISAASVRRIWKKHGLKPHLLRRFKLRKDPLFCRKGSDIVGLYLNPPAHALVVSVDEKSQVQALDRTQPGLPLKKGRAGTMTHDYKRNGTTTLFAALNTLDGKVIATCMPQHRHQEWLKFLHLIDKSTPRRKQLHLIIDNYSPHKHPAVQAWLKKHKRFHLTSRRPVPPGSTWSSASLEISLRNKSGAVASAMSPNSLKQSNSTWLSTTPTQSLLSGPQRLRIFWKRSNARVQLFISYDLFDALH